MSFFPFSSSDGKVTVSLAGIQFKYGQEGPLVIGSVVGCGNEDSKWIVVALLAHVANHRYEMLLVRENMVDADGAALPNMDDSTPRSLTVDKPKENSGQCRVVSQELIARSLTWKFHGQGLAIYTPGEVENLVAKKDKRQVTPKTTDGGTHRDHATAPEGYVFVESAKLERLEIERNQLLRDVGSLQEELRASNGSKGAKGSEIDGKSLEKFLQSTVTKALGPLTESINSLSGRIDGISGNLQLLEAKFKCLDAMEGQLSALLKSPNTPGGMSPSFSPLSPMSPTPLMGPSNPFYTTSFPYPGMPHGSMCQCTTCVCFKSHGPSCLCTGQRIKW